MEFRLSSCTGTPALHFNYKTTDTQMPGSGQVLQALYIAEKGY
jgi:hypothetical protein